MKHSLYLFLLALFISCAQPDAGPPPLDIGALVPVVADLHIAEALTNEIPVIVRDSLREVYYDEVLAEHNTDRAAFDSLMWIVRQEPAWVDSLYTKVGEVVARQQAKPE